MENPNNPTDESMEPVFKDTDFEDGELIFKTDIAETSDKPWWHKLPAMLACGTVLGVLAWFEFDKNHSWVYLLTWASGGALLFGGILALPFFRNAELKQINIFEDGFRIIDRQGTRTYRWTDLQAAHFETYPVSNMGTEIQCFEFRVNGKNVQVSIDGFGKQKIRLFFMVMDGILGRYEIPKETKGLRTFSYYLSLSGAWLFAASLVAMVIAYLLVFRTLGIIVGLTTMFTGSVIAMMTWKHAVSKWVITATIILITGSIVLIRTCDIDLQETLLKWEQQERKLGRPPWTETDPRSQG